VFGVIGVTGVVSVVVCANTGKWRPLQYTGLELKLFSKAIVDVIDAIVVFLGGTASPFVP
jgi:hypothetical protein